MERPRALARVEPLDAGPLAVGLRARVSQPKLPVAVWRVTEATAEREFTWETVKPGSRVIARHFVAALPAGTRVTTSVTYEGVLGRIAGWLVRGLTERYMAMESNGLKARSEMLARNASSVA